MIIGHIGGSAAGVDVGDTIANSLRYRGSNSAYATRSGVTPTDQKKWTYSEWVRNCSAQTYQILFAVGTSGSEYSVITISSGKLNVFHVAGGAVQWQLTTTMVFRDPGKHYHVYVGYDSTQATASNRVLIRINGTLVTAFDTASYPSLNGVCYINTPNTHYMGQFTPAFGSAYFDGVRSNRRFIDGQCIAYTEFGRVSNDTGAWVNKTYSGTYGANGDAVTYSNGTSLTTLGYDSSGNNNHWTLSGVSLTAGSTYDWLTDTPTNTFATLNPLFPTDDCTFSEGNLKFAYGSAPVPTVCFGSFGMSSGEWYWTTTITANSSGITSALVLGIANRMARLTQYPGYDSNGWGYYGDSGAIYNNSSTVASGASFGVGDVIGFKFNADTGTMRWYKQTAGTGSFVLQATVSSLPAGTYYPAFGDGGGTRTGAAAPNFGQQPISDTSWIGTAKALCTANIPDPAIPRGDKHFQTVLATGANIKTTAEAVFPAGFLEAIKDRANANNWQWLDSVRGTSAVLQSNTTTAETTYSAPSGSSVAHVWNMGSSTVTNTAGTITSQVRANVLAGQSVVTYTGTGANATVGHGLGVAPKMVITKSRTASRSWAAWHSGLTSANCVVYLDQTAAQAISSAPWNNTAPSSTVFSVGTAGDTNFNGNNFVAYCFAEIPGYSKIGSYIGNGSTDGPDVDCGGEIAYLLIKRADAATQWLIRDAIRDPYNVTGNALYANNSGAEVAATRLIDFTATGFKIRDTNTDINASGGSFIFYAVLKRPTKFSEAR